MDEAIYFWFKNIIVKRIKWLFQFISYADFRGIVNLDPGSLFAYSESGKAFFIFEGVY